MIDDRRRSVHKISRWSWLMKSIYNSFIVSGIFLVIVLGVRSCMLNVHKVDMYLSNISPYASASDMVDLNISQGFRGKIPKPIFWQLAKDLWPVVSKIFNEFTSISSEIRASVSGEEVASVQSPIVKAQVLEKPEGSSLLYLNSFCKDVLGGSVSLETCRRKFQADCDFDILAWFESGPNVVKVEACLTHRFRMRPDFFAAFDRRIREEETRSIVLPAKSKTAQKVMLVGTVVGAVTILGIGIYAAYEKVAREGRERRVALKIQEIKESIQSKTIQLKDDNMIIEEDVTAVCYDFAGSGDAIYLEHELFGFLTLIVLDPLPVHQSEAVLEEIKEIEAKNNHANEPREQRQNGYHDDSCERNGKCGNDSCVWEQNGANGHCERSPNGGKLVRSLSDEYALASLVLTLGPEDLLWPVYVDEFSWAESCESDQTPEPCEGSGNCVRTLHVDPQDLSVAIVVVQVYSTEEKSGDIAAEAPPQLEYLDISWQKNMLEEARVGITTIHQADFDFDIEGDLDGANEDNIFVCGLEQDKDDPLKFNYWRKRLRDIREELRAAALAKLRNKCPTLFKMGWFQNEATDEDEAKNEKESAKTAEMEENATNGHEQTEEDSLEDDQQPEIQQGLYSGTVGMDGEVLGNCDNVKTEAVTERVRQLSNNTFVAIA